MSFAVSGSMALSVPVGVLADEDAYQGSHILINIRHFSLHPNDSRLSEDYNDHSLASPWSREIRFEDPTSITSVVELATLHK